MKKNKKENIPVSNYVKLILLICLVVVIALIGRNIYVSNENYEKTIPIIQDVLINEINTSEVYNYIRENEDAVLYVGAASNDDCRKLEESLKSIIKNRNLEYRITYLNITKEKKKTTFIKEFNKFYGTNLSKYPSFIIFEEGKVKDIITSKKNEIITLSDVVNFLERNNITSDFYD